MTSFPGTPQHQQLLQAIVSYYAADPRIRSIIVFGSLGRGNWDAFSDIDLDIIVADNCHLVPSDELELLDARFRLIGEKIALVIPEGEDEAEVVFESLLQLSVRYHALRTTKPAILDSMQILAGPLDREAVLAAGQANPREPEAPLNQLLDTFIRDAVGAAGYVQRGTYWLSVEVLHRMRHLLMEIFQRTHHGKRTPQTFEKLAAASLQSRLKATLPGSDVQSLRQGLLTFLDILETDLPELSAGQLKLAETQRAILARLRAQL